MLGVLLQRQPSKLEIVNDKDRLIINWWQVVRDDPDELAHRLEHTPHSRVVYAEACDVVNQARATGESGVRVAWATMIIITQGRIAVLCESEEPHSHWSLMRRGNATPRAGLRIRGMADRLRDVHLECCDAVDLLNRVGTKPNTVVYCDPPYPAADDRAYHARLDDDRFVEAVLACRGRVAVSGHAGDWPQLDAAGWRREERPVQITVAQGGERIEALWCNYEPVDNRLF